MVIPLAAHLSKWKQTEKRKSLLLLYIIKKFEFPEKKTSKSDVVFAYGKFILKWVNIEISLQL